MTTPRIRSLLTNLFVLIAVAAFPVAVAGAGVDEPPDCDGIAYDAGNPSHFLYGVGTPVDPATGLMLVDLRTEASGRVIFWDRMFPMYTPVAGPDELARGAFINGTHHNDVICGTNGDDIIYGRQGNDRIFGMGATTNYNNATKTGGDWLFGNGGDDFIVNGASVIGGLASSGALLGGGPGSDSLYAGNGPNVFVRGGRDGDRLFAGTGAGQVMRGGAGNDVLWGSSGANQVLYGNGGNDIMAAGTGAGQILNGNRGTDQLTGGSGPDQRLFGGQDNDILEAGTGANQELRGGLGNDTILGGPGDDRIYGGPGNDTINGGPGDDVIYGGPGADTINGGAGNDLIYGNEPNEAEDYFFGTTIRPDTPDNAVDIMNGNDGDDVMVGSCESGDEAHGGAGDDASYHTAVSQDATQEEACP